MNKYQTNTIQQNAIHFIDNNDRNHLSNHFKTIFECLNVDLDTSQSSELHIRTSSINDWWFCRVRGHGHIRLSINQDILGLVNHAVLTLPLRGKNFSPTHATLFPKIGNITLNKWNGETAISSGDFDYITAYIPLEQLNKFSTSDIPYDTSIATFRGPGAILGNTFFSLVDEIVNSADPTAYHSLLPTFVNFAIATLQCQQSDEIQYQEFLSPRMQQITDYLNKHFDDPELTLTCMAKEIGISPRQISREFERNRSTFSSSLRSIRLTKAKQILTSQPQIIITQLAYQVGFNSPSAFGRSFLATYGMTPSKFRLKKWH